MYRYMPNEHPTCVFLTNTGSVYPGVLDYTDIIITYNNVIMGVEFPFLLVNFSLQAG